MASFSSLPRELVENIWRYVEGPKEIRSFALVASGIYFQARGVLKEDLQLRACCLNVVSIRLSGSEPARLLKMVLLCPRIALYIESFTIDSWRSCWEQPGRPQVGRHKRYKEATMEIFRNAMKLSPLVPRVNVGEWIFDMENGDEEPILALLITLLPNLTNLELRHSGLWSLHRDEGWLVTTIQRISRMANRSPLSQLATVSIQHLRVDIPGDLRWVELFSALPSVRSVYASSEAIE